MRGKEREEGEVGGHARLLRSVQCRLKALDRVHETNKVKGEGNGGVHLDTPCRDRRGCSGGFVGGFVPS